MDLKVGKLYKVLYPLSLSPDNLTKPVVGHLEVGSYVVILELGVKKDNLNHIVTMLVGKRIMCGCVTVGRLRDVFVGVDNET